MEFDITEEEVPKVVAKEINEADEPIKVTCMWAAFRETQIATITLPSNLAGKLKY